MKNNQGFSLIELLISMFMIVFISSTLYAALNMFFKFWDREYNLQRSHEQLVNFEVTLREDVLLASSISLPEMFSLVVSKNKEAVLYVIDGDSQTVKRNNKVLLRNIVYEDTYFVFEADYLKYSVFFKTDSGSYGRKGVYACRK